MSLDCNTEKGRQYINYQDECIKKISDIWGINIVQTINTKSADIDAIAIKNNQISAVLEVKTRESSLDQLKKWGSYLITFEKLLKIRASCNSLQVPGFLVVFLLDSNNIVYWKICDSLGSFLISFEAKNTITQKTCNGSQINRLNAYISLDDMQILKN
jgi:hypothetical protein